MTFDGTLHPRATSGEFTPKSHTAPDFALAGEPVGEQQDETWDMDADDLWDDEVWRRLAAHPTPVPVVKHRFWRSREATERLARRRGMVAEARRLAGIHRQMQAEGWVPGA